MSINVNKLEILLHFYKCVYLTITRKHVTTMSFTPLPNTKKNSSTSKVGGVVNVDLTTLPCSNNFFKKKKKASYDNFIENKISRYFVISYSDSRFSKHT